MKTDIYTKIILTVIAIFLGILVFQNTTIITTAKAETTVSAPTPLPTATQNAPVDVNITHIDGIKIRGKDSFGDLLGLPVTIYNNLDK